MAVSEAALIEAGIQVGLIRRETVAGLRLTAKRERLHLLEVVCRSGRFPETALYQALADTRGIPFLALSELHADGDAVALLPRALIQKRLMLPVTDGEGRSVLALSDPDDRLSLERTERATGRVFQIGLSDPDTLKTAIGNLFSRGGAPAGGFDGGREKASDSVGLLNGIMKDIYLHRASDVHFEPLEDRMRIRIRVDGKMQTYPRSLSKAEEEAVMNRIKVLSGLDIAEQRMAQDGAMKYAVSDWNLGEADIRVATIPTKWGERCTMRILSQDTEGFSLAMLGMPGPMLDRFRRAISSPHGMILVTGPTGSGKSTTLYAGIRELDLDRLNVLTVEDPVEQPVTGVSQVQVSTKVNFAKALRSFLRHDPDVILVGEIRDRETVEIGLRAAMTGHLVLSTLHTNDAVGAVTRLADIGAERFLIGSTLIGVLAQRLARRLCPHCRKKRPALPEELALLGREEALDIYEPGGCSLCLGSGFRGRIGLFEALWIGRDLSMAISEGAGEAEIRRLAPGMTTLWQDCCAKVAAGDVALDEVLHLRPEEG